MWKTSYFQRKSMVRSRVASFEPLDHRTLLAGDVINAAAAAEVAENVAPQYFVNHPPRLQPGNAPLIGTSAFDGFDQVDVLWQTEAGGEGTSDTFVTEYRRSDELVWIPAIDNGSFPTDVGTRVMHSASIKMLEWDTAYEYRVKHLRAGEVIETYQNTFQTRLPAGDPSPFSFAAYGDSAVRNRQDFNSVQARINQTDPDFSVLLGDNFYTFGTHVDADARFDPENSPAAIEWNSKKIDYFSVGNHDIFIEQGKASRDLFSNPVPLAGVTSPVQHPADEIDEFNFSFDYGDVHFVTFDTNPVDITKEPEERTRRLDELIDYVVADLAASNAKWKIVYGHHPFIGTEKRQKADDFYFQKIVSSFADADVDLIMLAHSHTYSWTYPITGFSDANQDGIVGDDEIEFVKNESQVFEKGSGLIQLVSGVGGGSLRSPDYEQDVFAQAYSRSEKTGPIEFGYAHVDVTQQSLTISYISGETGNIVGDTNANGVRDADEPFFGQFKVIDPSEVNPDFNNDGAINQTDIDLLFAAIQQGENDFGFDLDQNGILEQEDVDHLLKFHFDTTRGDTNLDGTFDSSDLVLVFQIAEYEDDIAGNSTWADGDWNGDSEFTSADLVIAFQNGGFVRAASQAAIVGNLASDDLWRD